MTLALAVIPAFRIGRSVAVPPGRVLALPAEQKILTDLIAVARDAGELRRWLYDLRYTTISSAGPCQPAPRWTPEASDRYLDFWRLFTRSTETAQDGMRVWRIVPGQPPRALALDEPPGLVELAAPGDQMLARGLFREALEAYERARVNAPSLALLLARIGTCRLRLGDAPGAVVAVSRALARAGAGAELLDQLGLALMAAGQPGRAATAWEQAAGFDDANATRWVKAAQALADVGAGDAARAAAHRALDRDPANRPARDILKRLGTP